MLIFFDVWAKNNFSIYIDIFVGIGKKPEFFKLISRKFNFPRNIGIFGNMDKNDIFKVISI